jgi:guanidinoacetate N-methyltransferase
MPDQILMKKRYPRYRNEWLDFEVELTQSELLIGKWQVMQKWEDPLMEALAREVTWNKGDILEIGFGMGISANKIINCGCRSYTVIEAHPKIAENARLWGKEQKIKVKVLEGFWQDVVPLIKSKYDGILFDTFPFHKKEKFSNHYPFIPCAPSLLKNNGVVTFFSDEKIPFRNTHLTLLLNHFKEVKLINVGGLVPPEDCEYWSESYMIIPVAKKIKE